MSTLILIQTIFTLIVIQIEFFEKDNFENKSQQNMLSISDVCKHGETECKYSRRVCK